MPQDLCCTVTAHRPVGPSLFLLTCCPPPGQAQHPLAWQPGQFVMIDLPTPAFMLRRPMSVMRVHADGQFDIFYKVHGQGTALMASQLQPGQPVRVLGALGRGFAIDPQCDPAHTLLIGGGIGIAPLIMLADALAAEGRTPPVCVYGVRSQADLGVLDALTGRFGTERLWIATDDGSRGQPGNVCDVLQAHADTLDGMHAAYICGPTPMMRAAHRWLAAHFPAITQQVSLEIMMPCGTGACGACVTHRRDGALPQKTCLEGPVFDPATIVWPGDETMAEATGCEHATCQGGSTP